jgi:hypothetical protein
MRGRAYTAESGKTAMDKRVNGEMARRLFFFPFTRFPFYPFLVFTNSLSLDHLYTGYE